MKINILALSFFLFLPSSLVLADNQWIQKATQAGNELLRGNPEGAVRRIVPQAGWNVPGKGYAGIDPNGAYFNQPLNPPRVINPKLLNLQGAYRARTSFGQNFSPNLNHSAQMRAGNRYVSNTTSVTPPSLKKKS